MDYEENPTSKAYPWFKICCRTAKRKQDEVQWPKSCCSVHVSNRMTGQSLWELSFKLLLQLESFYDNWPVFKKHRSHIIENTFSNTKAILQSILWLIFSFCHVLIIHFILWKCDLYSSRIGLTFVCLVPLLCLELNLVSLLVLSLWLLRLKATILFQRQKGLSAIIENPVHVDIVLKM